jgi:hypothetical protein
LNTAAMAVTTRARVCAPDRYGVESLGSHRAIASLLKACNSGARGDRGGGAGVWPVRHCRTHRGRWEEEHPDARRRAINRGGSAKS